MYCCTNCWSAVTADLSSSAKVCMVLQQTSATEVVSGSKKHRKTWIRVSKIATVQIHTSAAPAPRLRQLYVQPLLRADFRVQSPTAWGRTSTRGRRRRDSRGLGSAVVASRRVMQQVARYPPWRNSTRSFSAAPSWCSTASCGCRAAPWLWTVSGFYATVRASVCLFLCLCVCAKAFGVCCCLHHPTCLQVEETQKQWSECIWTRPSNHHACMHECMTCHRFATRMHCEPWTLFEAVAGAPNCSHILLPRVHTVPCQMKPYDANLEMWTCS